MSNDSKKVVVRKNKFGRAVFAKRTIYKNEIVAVFDGPIYDDLFDGWTDDLLNHTIQIGPALWRDSTGIARLINHSCDPNCGIKNYIQVVAMRTILPGEEIFWDYEMTEKNPWWKMRCGCGSPLCRKTIGNYKNMPKAVREKYKGFISKWLLK
ncbi:MAG: SET domain-containing protein-lysine N-methyltransferase [Bdellovibrionaceae bacterium]|nr:SET domain-containing protein-lysine N-methyltransferase [Pseudobdellovibrionaceae bacterium]